MIHYLCGSLSLDFDGGIVVETAGVGYKVYVPDNSPLYADIGKDKITVYTVMVVREDDMSLYGFHNGDNLKLFQLLRTVNGIGAKVALSILSSIPADQIKKAIAFEDSNALTKAVGVGKKMAQRIVLELKDKIGDTGGLSDLAQSTMVESGKAEAVNALIGLGYSRSEAISSVGAVGVEGLSTEEYIRLALKAGAAK
jgi:Holliday junction DNA helicase RuvA